MPDNRESLEGNYPSNSKLSKQERNPEKTPEDKKIKKVVTGTVKKQKRGFFKKVSDSLLEDNTKSVGSYIFYDVLIPAAKDMISDMVSGGIEMLLFGDRRSSRGVRSYRGGSGRTYTNYGSYSSSPATRDSRERDRDVSRAARARHELDDVIIDNRGEAEDVLAHLVDLTIDYQMASVADFYDLLGITSNFTDNKYGWTDLKDASVSRARGGGYIINLPRPVPID